MTLIPWQAGRNLLWDVTVVDTLAASHLPSTSRQMGGAAESAGEKKEAKYHEMERSTLSSQSLARLLVPSTPKALLSLADLGRHIALVTGDPHEGSFLFQRLSITVQRFNSVCFKSSFTTPPDTESFQRKVFFTNFYKSLGNGSTKDNFFKEKNLY